MKKLFTSLLLFITVTAFSETYYWVGGTGGAWNSSSSWNTMKGGGGTTRSIVLTTDVLIFDGSDIGGGASAPVIPSITGSYVIGQLKLQNSAIVTFMRGATTTGTTTLTINGDGTAADDLEIDATSILTLTSGTVAYGYALQLGVATTNLATGTIYGRVNINDGGAASTTNVRLTTHNPNSLIFENGSIVYARITGSTSVYPLGSSSQAAANSVIFESGSTYVYQGGGSVFGNTSASSISIFLSGSTMVFESNSIGNFFSNRSYANVIVRPYDGGVAPVTVTVDGNFFNIDTLTIEANGTFNLAASGVAPFSGDIINNGTFGAVTPTLTSNLLFKGIVPQNIGGTGTFNPIGAVTVATDSYLTLHTNLVHNGTSTGSVTGTINFQQYSISGSGNFQLRPAATVNGTAATVSQGNRVITVTGDYSSANVTIGGLVTGTGIPANTYIISTNSGSNQFTISNLPVGNGTEVNIHTNAATAITSNTAGLDGSMATTSKSFGSGSNYIFNAATVTPFPAGVSSITAGSVTFNENILLNKPFTVDGMLTVKKELVTAENNITLNAVTGSAVFAPLSSLHISDAAAIVDFNERQATFMSNAAGTARLAPVTGTLSNATNVTVERFIGMPTAKRAWRLLTTPLRAATTDVSVYEAWQNSGAMTTGDGTLITGPNATAGDGLDAVSGHSLKSYNANVLTGVDNTMTTPLFTTASSAANKSYFLFVRGDRSGTDLTHVSQTTLTPTGALQTGSQNFAASAVAGEFSLVGNPYPSPVDFAAVTRDNIMNRFYVWDPSLNVVGGYVLVDDATNSGTYTVTPNPSSPSGTSAQTQHIQSSQAFFVQTQSNGAASLTFEEGDKSAININNVFRTGNGSDEKLNINLYLENGTSTLADGVAAFFNTAFSSNVDLLDAKKMQNINENLSLMRSAQELMLERRPLIVADDTLFIRLTNTSARSYQFEFVPGNFTTSMLSAFLVDSYLQTSTPLDLNANTNISFTVTTDAASAVADRFMIVFKSASTLPVNFTNVKAYKQNAGINVEWNVATEQGTVSYEVEKSADGRSFAKAGTVLARGSNSTASYTWNDANVFAGSNFYRIKAIENNGNAKYSAVVNVRTDKAGAGITVYPNPVKGNVIKMQMNNQREGNYTIQLFNAVGQELFRTIVSHNGASSAQTVSLPSSIEKGIYQLVVKGDEYTSTQQLIISK